MWYKCCSVVQVLLVRVFSSLSLRTIWEILYIFRSKTAGRLSSIKYFQNISYYGTFLRVVLMKWLIENNMYIFILLVWNWVVKLHRDTLTKSGEKGNSSSLRCKRYFYLHQAIKNQTKKIKSKSFDTESHNSFYFIYPVNSIFHLH